ncbi:DUF433 domain-containing protein [Massilia terrae]|uniref:DUF433 domain-containing protein n=1 Tax=Massilia terrae TaxID=1811224 RepID=A0ABT2D3L8_9BURK|nr:DUF433 domain-containing protein [Massilia terrae]MCS0660843.1 DUF433 domain-containing protein [Massilia terrae]
MSSYISRNPDILGGTACFVGTRVPIKTLFDYLESVSSLDEFLEDFPTVTSDAAVGVIIEARDSLLKDETAP